MANKMICNSCGGIFEDNLAKCPYCGSMNISGAEAEYMNKLDDVREDMEDLEDVPMEETKKEFRKQGRFLKKIFGVLLVIVGILAIIIGIVEWNDSSYERKAKKDYLWQQENFPIFDKLYEEGKYQELIEVLYSDKNAEKPVWKWSHYEFVGAYLATENLADILEEESLGTSKMEILDYEAILNTELTVMGFLQDEENPEEDKEILMKYAKPALQDFEERWNMSQEEQEAYIAIVIKNGGYISFEECKPFVQKWYDENISAK